MDLKPVNGSNPNMVSWLIRNIADLYSLFTRKQKKKFVALVIFITIVSFFDALGIVSILPFLTLLINPEMANTNKYFIAVYDYFDFQSSESFLISIGITSIVIFNTSQILRALSFFIQNKFFLISFFPMSW